MAVPTPSNVAPWYLRDLCQALQLDEITGNVFMRTGIQGNVYITGPVTVPAGITITGGNSNVAVIGNIAGVTSLPPITGNVNANITGGNSNVAVIGNIAGITALPPITGNVNANITGGNSNVTVIGNIAGITSLPVITATISGGNSNVAVIGNIAGITSLPPITGNVNANITGGNVNANITGGNVRVTQGTTPWSVTGNLITTGTTQTSIVGMNIDAFGRLRSSEPHTLFDSALNGARRYDFSSATTGAATVSWNFNANVRNLTVTTAAGDSVVRESMLVFPYQPGKSLLTMNSFVLGETDTGRTQRIGLFSASNGIYFQNVGKTISFCLRSKSSGAVTNTVVNQAAWNGDRLDGTGPSGITFDETACQLLWLDVEWLGVGSVRCGFVVDGVFILCHTFNHANNPSFTTTYMGTAVLPVRYEIINDTITPSGTILKQICSTVISEGGYDQAAATYTAGTGTNTVRLTTAHTYYPITSIRLNSSYLNSIVKINQVDILSPTVNYYRWVVLKNAVLTGATWADPSGTVRVDVDTAATALTGGIEVQSGFASSRELADLVGDAFYGRLGRTLAGVSDTFTLAIAATANNSDVLAQLGWQEIV